LIDTDGDSIPDGVEVQTGTIHSTEQLRLEDGGHWFRLAAASFVLTTSVLFPNVSRQ